MCHRLKVAKTVLVISYIFACHKVMNL